jgi:uncharacterized protein (DUF2267 family)
VTVPPSIAQTVQKTQEWLKELIENGDLADMQESLAVLRAVLHHLRDRLTLEEAVDLGAQLRLSSAVSIMKDGSRANARIAYGRDRSSSIRLLRRIFPMRFHRSKPFEMSSRFLPTIAIPVKSRTSSASYRAN